MANANRCRGLPAVVGAKEGGGAVSWGRAGVGSQCRGTRREVGEEGGGVVSSAPAPERLRRPVRLSSLLLSSLDVCLGVAVPQRGGGVVGIALGLGESAYIANLAHGIAVDGRSAIGTRVGRRRSLG